MTQLKEERLVRDNTNYLMVSWEVFCHVFAVSLSYQGTITDDNDDDDDDTKASSVTMSVSMSA